MKKYLIVSGCSWGDPNYCDTLWVVHSNHDKNIQAPFGQTCIYEKDESDF